MTPPTPSNTHSVAHKGEGAQMFAPAAARNMQVIGDLLEAVAPKEGQALELASGTGQHVVHFAARLPGLHWQPTEIDAERRASIDAHADKAGLSNISPAIEVNACQPGWGAQQQGKTLIVLINLLHLVTEQDAESLISETSAALVPGGRLVTYGPFMRAGELTSDGDARFHASLTDENPQIGYKDDFDVMDMIQAAGLEMADSIEMPANNLALVAVK